MKCVYYMCEEEATVENEGTKWPLCQMHEEKLNSLIDDGDIGGILGFWIMGQTEVFKDQAVRGIAERAFRKRELDENN